MYRTDKVFMKDPATVSCRIYIGGLDESVKAENLEEKFKVHGTILGLVLQRGFGFIQYDTENAVKQAIQNEHGQMFHGRKLNVKQALDGKKAPPPNQISQDLQQEVQASQEETDTLRQNTVNRGSGGRHRVLLPPRRNMPIVGNRSPTDMSPYYNREERYAVPPPLYAIPNKPERNDCEIIVVAKELTVYAEYVEKRLHNLGLVVDLLFPNADVPLGRVLANISSRGCLYAILVTPQNEEHRSLTLNILHGIPEEHRNMPLEDSLLLITRNFDSYIRTDMKQSDGTPSLTDRHPEPIQILINLLAENRQLTTLQYDRIIKYLHERRELQMKHEIGDSADVIIETEPISKQAELQSRILNILNKSSSPKAAPQAPAATPLLNDPSVQKALDSLLQGDILKGISGDAFKF